ncbi:sulfatase-like hydrolase/transferase [Hydrogenophaga sp. 2FB]|uniref:sulfatase-like hydrolase/transferase n=1 Tax=Hydrogenophaga sp. 2FB TaxID=2502187 RepID=UPI0010F8A2D5|nr:sulfatase-like hydrolase/transferase [Hydrogenophaga sp. 2FB]
MSDNECIAAHVKPAFQGRIGKTLTDSMPHWPAPVRAPQGAPNVVMVLLDDLGYSDFGCFGGDIDTPNIDALAAQGLRFSRYTTVPMCTPARAALLTGKNPHSVGCGWLTHSDPGYPGYKGEMSLDAPTMAELLRLRGYSTMAAGKWHNIYDRNNVPGGDTSAWPVQRGFERFYGFQAAETSYFQPENMMEGNQPAQAGVYPPDYFAPDDYTQRSLDWITDHRSGSPDKPFFLYLAYQTPHAPLQAKSEDIRKYRGRYDAGWDAVRQARFERQCAAGLLEPNAQFIGRNAGIPAWDELTPESRALHARYMEVYAALVDNVDQNIGKLVAHLKHLGQLDNTIIMITSDNGANSVGGPTGVMNLQGQRVGIGDDDALNQRLLKEDRIGARDTYLAYPTGWTQVSNTPYRLYKRTTMNGGIRVPFVLHWPEGVAEPDRGAVRTQWIHVTDVLPTVMEACGAELPAQFNGYRTRALDGVSFGAMLRDAQAPTQRSQQYYELAANRGFISGDWKIVSLQPPQKAIDLDNWMLFDLANDPVEQHDLASQHPEVLQRLIAEFERHADANYVYPLDNRTEARSMGVPPHEVERMLLPRECHRAGQGLPGMVTTPLVADRSYRIHADFGWKRGDEGIVFSLGDRFSGLVVFVEEGALHCVYQWWFNPKALPPVPLSEGPQRFTFDYEAMGDRRGRGRLVLNGVPVTEAVELSPTLLRITGGLNVGLSRRLAVAERLEARGEFRYTGTIERVRIEPGALPAKTSLVQNEAELQARMRATTATS